MATKAARLRRCAASAPFWDAFRALAASRVRECNAIAGAPLWETLDTSDTNRCFLIRSRHNAADFLECSLDRESEAVLCRPGPAIRGETLQFPLSGDVCSSAQAVTMALDRLVSVEERDWEPGDAMGVEVP